MTNDKNHNPEKKLTIEELKKLPFKERVDYMMRGLVNNLNRNVVKDHEGRETAENEKEDTR